MKLLGLLTRKTATFFRLMFTKPRWLWHRKILENSIFFTDEAYMASLLPSRTLELTAEMFKPKTVLDLGCGTGKSLDYFVQLGIDCIGVEGSKELIAQSRHPARIVQFNLNKALDLNRKFDLVWSFEFVEHIKPQYVHNLMRTFFAHSNVVVLSAAHPGQGGAGHFNEQPKEYWISLFQEYGFELAADKTKKLVETGDLHSENMLVFEKTQIA